MKFIDGVAMHKAHPGTFSIPDPEEKKRIKVGDNIKVGIRFRIPKAQVTAERFWTIVKKIDGDVIEAVVDNDLVYTDAHGLRLHSKIKFTMDNVLATTEPL